MRPSTKSKFVPTLAALASVAAAALWIAVAPHAPDRGAALVSEAQAGATTGATTPASADLFTPVAAVLKHQRCMNCHPRDDRPRQGEDRHPHLQNVMRGADNMGFVNMRCTACHRDENNQFSGVPGAPNWHLAPQSMGWQGLTDAEICTALKDLAKNGGKDMKALVEHLESDKLVLWGWAPGGTRAPVPTPHAEFITQVKAWAAANGPCPAAK